MSRKKKKRAKKPRTPWLARLSEAQRRTMLRVFGVIVVLAAAGPALSYGYTQLDAHVRRTLSAEVTPRIEFVDLPPVLHDLASHDLVAPLGDVLDGDWTDNDRCRVIADRLRPVGWIERIEHVRRRADGLFAVDCRYRQPAALVQRGADYFLVDGHGVRLPGQYRYDGSWPLIQGVTAAAPDAGHRWPGNEVSAGLEVFRALLRQPYADQITTVMVENLGGRVDPRRSHIVLGTDRPGGRILWGSAPGREIEENSVEQKLAILAANYRQSGRVDAGHAVIDIAAWPDRFTIPGAP